MNAWDNWKSGFDAWENATATLVETWMKSPLVLVPGGHALAMAMRAKAKNDDRLAKFWSTMGLPTRRDQERLLHAVGQLNSKIIDLEEQLADAEARARQANQPPGKSSRRAVAGA